MRSSDAQLLFQIFFSLLSTENSAATNHVPTAANQSTEFVLATATTNVDESAEGESSQINYHHQDKCHQNWRLQNVRMKYQRCTLYSHYHVDTFNLQTLCEWPGLWSFVLHCMYTRVVGKWVKFHILIYLGPLHKYPIKEGFLTSWGV